jgi:hypothetical protein
VFQSAYYNYYTHYLRSICVDIYAPVVLYWHWGETQICITEAFDFNEPQEKCHRRVTRQWIVIGARIFF